MKTPIPVRHLDEQTQHEEQIVREAWGDTRHEEAVKEEVKTVSVSGDWKTYAIIILLILFIAFLSGYFISDKGINRDIETITTEYTNISVSNEKIANEQKKINVAENKIGKAKEELKEKYFIIYQK